jgi:hypothetical protein
MQCYVCDRDDLVPTISLKIAINHRAARASARGATPQNRNAITKPADEVGGVAQIRVYA